MGLWLSLSPDRSPHGSWDFSHLKIRVEKNLLPVSLMWPLAGFSSYWVVGQRTSVPWSCRLQDPLFLAKWACLHRGLPTWQLASIRTSKQEEPERLNKTEIIVFLAQYQKQAIAICAIFKSLEASLLGPSHTQGEGITQWHYWVTIKFLSWSSNFSILECDCTRRQSL